ncbi:MAG: Ig-like domain-containing protein, partial [Gammaproteobacteria bacterium]|nr:Ig-like domain-containing protein [Gammaproteobacteria bacterium]
MYFFRNLLGYFSANHGLKRIFLAFSISISLSHSLHAAYSVYEFGQIRNYSNSLTPHVFLDLNNKGEIAGTIFRNTDYWLIGLAFNDHDFRGFYANASSGVVDIGDLGGNNTVALAINDNGKIVGWSTKFPSYTGYLNFDNVENNYAGYVWQNGQFTQSATSAVLDIDNNDVTIEGYLNNPLIPILGTEIHKRNLSGQGISFGFGAAAGAYGFSSALWSQPSDPFTGQPQIDCLSETDPLCTAGFFNGTTWTNLGTLGGSLSTAFDLNNAGQVVGTSSLANDSPNSLARFRAFLWQDGLIHDLIAEATSLPTDTNHLELLQNGNTRAISINSQGQVLIQARSSSNPWRYLLGDTDQNFITAVNYFLWDNGVITPIDTLWPTTPSQYRMVHLSSINDRGQIAGVASEFNNNHTPHRWSVVLLSPETQTTDIEFILSGDTTGTPGTDLNYNAILTNIGILSAEPHLKLRIPAHVSSITLPQGCDRTTWQIECNLPELTSGSAQSLDFVLRTDHPDGFTIVADVKSKTNSDPYASNNFQMLVVNIDQADAFLKITQPQTGTIIGAPPSGTASVQIRYSMLNTGTDQVEVFVDDVSYGVFNATQFMVNGLIPGNHRLRVHTKNIDGNLLTISDTIDITVAEETVIRMGNNPLFFGNRIFTSDVDIKGDFVSAAGADFDQTFGDVSIFESMHFNGNAWENHTSIYESINSSFGFSPIGGVASTAGLNPLANLKNLNDPYIYSAFLGRFSMSYFGELQWINATGDGDIFNQHCCVSFAIDADGTEAFVQGFASNDFVLGGIGTGGVKVGAKESFVSANLPSTYIADLVPQGIGAGDEYGRSVAIEGNIVVAGAPGDDDLGSAAGAAYVFEFNGVAWEQKAKLVANDGKAHDRFGLAVEVNQNTIVIGAPLRDQESDELGALYLFEKIDGQWTQIQILTAKNYGKAARSPYPAAMQTGPQFGHMVSMEGNLLATTGASADQGTYQLGEVHLFTRTASNWGDSRKLISSQTDINLGISPPYLSGYDVSVSGDMIAVRGFPYVHIFRLPEVDIPVDMAIAYEKVSITAPIGSPLIEGKLHLSNVSSIHPTNEVVFNFPFNIAKSDNQDCHIFPETLNVVRCYIGDISPDYPGQILFRIQQDFPVMQPIPVGQPWDLTMYPAEPVNSLAGNDVHISVSNRWPDPNLQNNSVVIQFPDSFAPSANDDQYALDEGETFTASISVTANDVNPMDDGLFVNPTAVQAPLFGLLTLNTNGTFTYQHDGSENHSDSFVYRVRNGVGSAVATVILNINPVNDAPIAVDNVYTLDENAFFEVSAPGVMANDSDAENDALSVSLVTLPQHGALTLNSDGSFGYAHDGSEASSDQFSYQLTDGLETTSAIVNLNINNINDAPMANDDAYTLDEAANLTINAPGLLQNDTDAEASALQVNTQVIQPPLNGTLILLSDGSFEYQHNGNETTSDTFVYEISDGDLSSRATVNLTINPINNPPIATDDEYNLNEGQTLQVVAPGLLLNDSDVDTTSLSVVISPVTQPSHGELTLHP